MKSLAPDVPLSGYGGWLAVFGTFQLLVLPILVVIEWVATAASVDVRLDDQTSAASVIWIIQAVGQMIVVAFGIYAAIQLRDVHPRALEMNERFLVAALLWSAICNVLPFAADIPDDRRDAMAIPSMVNFALIVSYALVWFWYVKSSKRMKATYGQFYAKIATSADYRATRREGISTLGTTSAAPLYAGFWRRVAASSFDAPFLAALNTIIGMAILDRVPRLLLGIIVYCAFYAGFHSSSSQATPGKKFFGIKVTDHEGKRIGLGRAIGRYFAVVLSFIVLCLGFLPAAFTQKRQALHDMICGTLVVNRNAEPVEVVAGGGVMPVTAGVFAVAGIAFAVPLALILIFVAIPAYQDYVVRVKVAELDASRASKGEVERTSAANRAWTTADGDVTKIGILANPDFRGDTATILGLSLGQTWEEARKIVQANPKLSIHDDSLNKRRFYVDDRGGPAALDRAVFYCQWPDGTPGMGRLVIYPRIARFLPAGDERLFVASSVATLPPDVKSWLGPEHRAVVTLNTSGAKNTTHVYERRALEVSDDTVMFLPPSVHVVFVRPDLLPK